MPVVLLAALVAMTIALNGWYHAERAARARAHREAGHVRTAEEPPGDLVRHGVGGRERRSE